MVTSLDPASLERELTTLALEGADWAGLLARFSDRTGLPVSLIGVHGEPLVMPTGDGAPRALSAGDIASAFAQSLAAIELSTDSGPATGMPVLSGTRRVGLLATPGAVEPRRVALLESARTAIAIEGVRRDTLRQARSENASQIVDELRYGSLRNPGRVARAALKFGITLDRPHRGVVFHYRGPQRHAWATAVAWLPTPTRMSGDLAWTVADEATVGELVRVQTRMQGIVGDEPLRMSVGASVRGGEHTAASFRSAESGLGLLLNRGDTTLSYDDLGAEQLLMELSVEQLHAFAARQIGPLLGRDDLMTTLRMWFELDGSRGAIAERLFLHRNSVGYRLGLIKQLLGADSFEPTRSPHLLAGLQAHQVALAMETFAALPTDDHSMTTPSPST